VRFVWISRVALMLVPLLVALAALVVSVVVGLWAQSASGMSDDSIHRIASIAGLAVLLPSAVLLGRMIGRLPRGAGGPASRLVWRAVALPAVAVVIALISTTVTSGGSEGGVHFPPIGVNGLRSLPSLVLWITVYGATAIWCAVLVRRGRRWLAGLVAAGCGLLAVALYVTVDILVWFGPGRARLAMLPLWFPATIVPLGVDVGAFADPAAYEYPTMFYPMLPFVLLAATALGLAFLRSAVDGTAR
jgi:hypothetical protein